MAKDVMTPEGKCFMSWGAANSAAGRKEEGLSGCDGDGTGRAGSA